MKEVLSVFSFGIGALCFAAFVTIFTPKPINALPGVSKPAHCNTELSLGHQRPRHMFAAVALRTKNQMTSFAGAHHVEWLLVDYGDAKSCNEHRFV
jgi:hypothetical protein